MLGSVINIIYRSQCRSYAMAQRELSLFKQALDDVELGESIFALVPPSGGAKASKRATNHHLYLGI
jgi:hypothetical protein